MCTSSVSNVIYHKFSHGAAFYTLNGKNVNVMLELCVTPLNTKNKRFYSYIENETARDRSVVEGFEYFLLYY